MTEASRARNVFFVGVDVDSMGGSQRVLHTLAQGMGERGHRVELIGIRPSPEPFPYNATRAYRHATLYPPAADPKPPVRTVGDRLSLARRADARRARAAREHARAEMQRRLSAVEDGYIVFGSPWAVDWVMPLDWHHLKGVGQYHESFAQARRSANLGLIRRHYPALEQTLVLSEGDAVEFVNQRVPNVRVMPNPLPFYPDERAPLDTHRIGAVGRLDPIKRYDRMIEAFARARAGEGHEGAGHGRAGRGGEGRAGAGRGGAGREGWELHLFGDGPLENELRMKAEDLGVADQVVFRGTVEDMAAAYRELSVVAISSEREGRPMALAEAAACGVPCVSFDVSGGVRELVEDGVTGTLVPPADVPGLAAAFGELMDDAALRKRYGAAGREHVARLALPSVLDRWDAAFAEIER